MLVRSGNREGKIGYEKNGVLTAIEDFLKETVFSLSFHRVYSNNGLAIVTSANENEDVLISYMIDTSGM
jgi:hypothetical protein